MARAGSNHKGGRPKGSVSNHTLEAQELKKALISSYAENAKDINDALMSKAKAGDVPAIKEVYDRVYGKSMSPVEITGKDGEDLFKSNLATLSNAKLEGIIKEEGDGRVS